MSELIRALPGGVLFWVMFVSSPGHAASSSQADLWARAPVIVQVANSWRSGELIPLELLHYRKSTGDLPEAMDSEVLIAQINNLSLLAAVASDSSADLECREDAFVQGMYAGGPARFFETIAQNLSTNPRRSDAWVTELRSRIQKPHVVVDALFIKDADMPRQEANKVMDRIEHDLKAGGSWTSVYEEYANQFRKRMGITAIGNLGHFVVFTDPSLGRGHFVDVGPHIVTWEGEALPRRLWRMQYLDFAHVPALVRASPGEILRLSSATYREQVLYQVQEVYRSAH